MWNLILISLQTYAYKSVWYIFVCLLVCLSTLLKHMFTLSVLLSVSGNIQCIIWWYLPVHSFTSSVIIEHSVCVFAWTHKRCKSQRKWWENTVWRMAGIFMLFSSNSTFWVTFMYHLNRKERKEGRKGKRSNDSQIKGIKKQYLVSREGGRCMKVYIANQETSCRIFSEHYISYSIYFKHDFPPCFDNLKCTLNMRMWK
jgi:hypothetical protein